MSKIFTLPQVQPVIKKLKAEGKSLVLVGGCFDILHMGHLKFLEAAKKEGDVLMVALENDQGVERIKGKNRPVYPEQIRAENLIKTSLVDYVIIIPPFKTYQEYLTMTEIIMPDVIAITSGDPKTKTKEMQAQAVGGKIRVVINRLEKFSTTNILNNSRAHQKS